jgi:hypothetical protein
MPPASWRRSAPSVASGLGRRILAAGPAYYRHYSYRRRLCESDLKSLLGLVRGRRHRLIPRQRAVPSTAQLRHARASRSVGFVARGPRGVADRVCRLISCRARWRPSHLRWFSVSVVSRAAACCGVVRLGGRRWRACRCSRGRRPSGSDSEARDRHAALPQPHPIAVDGRLTRTRLRRACRLQRPCSPPICSCLRG